MRLFFESQTLVAIRKANKEKINNAALMLGYYYDIATPFQLKLKHIFNCLDWLINYGSHP